LDPHDIQLRNSRHGRTRPRDPDLGIVVVQTLGNLHADARAGLVFLTSEDRKTLCLLSLLLAVVGQRPFVRRASSEDSSCLIVGLDDGCLLAFSL